MEGNTAIWATVRGFRPEQWAWFRSVVELRGLLSGAVALVSSGVVSWEVHHTRHIAGWVFRCRAVGPGGGCMTALHMDGSHMSGETLGCCTVVVQVRSHTEGIWSCRSVDAIDAAVALVCLYTTESYMPEETCDFVVRLCLYTTGWYWIGYKLEWRVAGARAQLRTTEEKLKCYAVAVVVAGVVVAADYEPKAHNWPGAARWADSLHNLGLFLDAEIAPSHSAHMTTLAGALSGVLPLRDGAGAHSGLAEVRLGPVGRMMGAFREVFP